MASKLKDDWSPAQIASWLVVQYPGNETMRVSHETIYRSLFLQARGVLKKELITHLRRVHTMRCPRNATRQGEGCGGIIDAVSIRDRPAEIEDRAIPSHWEGNLIYGSNSSYIATLVERHSRFVKLVKVERKDTADVVAALIREVHRLPGQLVTSLTWDLRPTQSMETWKQRKHQLVLRQYFPKGGSMADYSQEHLDQVALKLNTRLRLLHFEKVLHRLVEFTVHFPWGTSIPLNNADDRVLGFVP